LISNKLDQNMAAIASVCPECNTITPVPASLTDQDATIQAIDNKYVARMGTLSARVRNAQAWVRSQITRVSSESNAYWNNVTGKDVLSGAQRELEDFLLEKEAPKFLSFQYSQSSKAFDDLRMFLFYDGSNILHQAFKAKLIAKDPPLDPVTPYYGFGTPMPASNEAPVFQALTGTDWKYLYKSLNKPTDDLGFRLITARKTALDKFDTASWSYGVAYVFCDFFQQADMYSSTLQQSCASQQAKNLNDSVSELVSRAPEWMAPTDGVRAADWASVLSAWSDKVSLVVGAGNAQLR
jgi:hypothetical protein